MAAASNGKVEASSSEVIAANAGEGSSAVLPGNAAASNGKSEASSSEASSRTLLDPWARMLLELRNVRYGSVLPPRAARARATSSWSEVIAGLPKVLGPVRAGTIIGERHERELNGADYLGSGRDPAAASRQAARELAGCLRCRMPTNAGSSRRSEVRRLHFHGARDGDTFNSTWINRIENGLEGAAIGAYMEVVIVEMGPLAARGLLS